MIEPFYESGMKFEGFDRDDFYWIEKSNRRPEGTSSVEFVLRKENSLMFVEAKQSFPKPENDVFSGRIGEICKKYTDSLMVFSGTYFRSPSDLPYHSSDYPAMGLRFILIINGFEKQWLKPIADSIKRAMAQYAKLWLFDPNRDIAVLNHEMALKYELISGRL